MDSGSPWTPAFATDLISQGSWDGVKCWIFGHTHYSTDFQCDGIRLAANQRGYVLQAEGAEGPKEVKTKRNLHVFDPAMTIAL